MATLALTTITLFTLLTPIQSQSSLTCNRDISRQCGPCTGAGNAECRLNCAFKEDACVESTLTCQAGKPCTIGCTALYGCMGAIIRAESATSLVMNCGPKATSCESARVIGGIGIDIAINCDGYENSCKELTLEAPNGGNIVVNCFGWNSCTGLVVMAQYAKNAAVNCNNPGNCQRMQLLWNGPLSGNANPNPNPPPPPTNPSPPIAPPQPPVPPVLSNPVPPVIPNPPISNANPNPPILPAPPVPPVNPNPNPNPNPAVPVNSNPVPPANSNPSPPNNNANANPATGGAAPTPPVITWWCREEVMDIDEVCEYLWDNVCQQQAERICSYGGGRGYRYDYW